MLLFPEPSRPNRLPSPQPATFAVLQRRLHGTRPLVVPAAPGRRRALSLLRLTPLPQVDLQTVVEQEQGWWKRQTGSGN